MIETQLAPQYLEKFLDRTALLNPTNTRAQRLTSTELNRIGVRLLNKAAEEAKPIVADGLLNKDLSQMVVCSMLATCRSKFAQEKPWSDVFYHAKHPLLFSLVEDRYSASPANSMVNFRLNRMPDAWRNEIEFWRGQLSILTDDFDKIQVVRESALFGVSWALWREEAGLRHRLPVTRIGCSLARTNAWTKSGPTRDDHVSFGFDHSAAKPSFI